MGTVLPISLSSVDHSSCVYGWRKEDLLRVGEFDEDHAIRAPLNKLASVDPFVVDKALWQVFSSIFSDGATYYLCPFSFKNLVNATLAGMPVINIQLISLANKRVHQLGNDRTWRSQCLHRLHIKCSRVFSHVHNKILQISRHLAEGKDLYPEASTLWRKVLTEWHTTLPCDKFLVDADMLFWDVHSLKSVQ